MTEENIPIRTPVKNSPCEGNIPYAFDQEKP